MTLLKLIEMLFIGMKQNLIMLSSRKKDLTDIYKKEREAMNLNCYNNG